MSQKLKEEIHRLIDEIEDDETLLMLKEDIALYKTTDDETLTEHHVQEIKDAIEEDNRGETISYTEFTNHADEWKKKLSSVKNS